MPAGDQTATYFYFPNCVCFNFCVNEIIKMASSSRPKRQRINDCINDDEIVNELFCDELSDFSYLSEIDDSDADRDYFPSESDNSVADSTNTSKKTLLIFI
jgi:hypothetical protein